MTVIQSERDYIVSASLAELRGKGPKLLPFVLLLLVTCQDKEGRICASSFSKDLENLAGILSFGNSLRYALQIAFPDLPDSIRKELPDLDEEIGSFCQALTRIETSIKEAGKKAPYCKDRHRIPCRLAISIIFAMKQTCIAPARAA